MILKAVFLILNLAVTLHGEDAFKDMVLIPAGSYLPLYAENGQKTFVDSYWIDVRAVSNSEFKIFVNQNPRWKRSKAKKIFSEASYLKHWKSHSQIGSEKLQQAPVIFVSWFAANAYCQAQGKSLPSVDQWEYLASMDLSDPKIKDRLVEWYSRPTQSLETQEHISYVDKWGVQDLLGLIWEWTLDFNTAMVTGESRGDSDVEKNLFCGGAASGAGDFKDYAAFMRFAYRSSLKATYSTANLGFRCVKTGRKI